MSPLRGGVLCLSVPARLPHLDVAPAYRPMLRPPLPECPWLGQPSTSLVCGPLRPFLRLVLCDAAIARLLDGFALLRRSLLGKLAAGKEDARRGRPGIAIRIEDHHAGSFRSITSALRAH